MLRILFGKAENVYYGPSWFKFNYEIKWFEDKLVGEMLESIDKSRYVGGELIESEVLGPIAPTTLSGGLKTLISIYENPELVFDASSCGGNCAKWLLKLGEQKELTVNLNYIMDFSGCEPFEIYIENVGRVVKSYKEYVDIAIDYV